MAYVFLFRTSWNSSSKELGLSTDDGTAVPLTLPVAPTWGNKFPIARDPALFLLLPSKPKGPTLKKWGVGTLNTLTIGPEKRGKIFNSLTFHFKFCLFARYGPFSVLFLFFKGNEMELKGTFH